jgi:hypothetical protein
MFEGRLSILGWPFPCSCGKRYLVDVYLGIFLYEGHLPKSLPLEMHIL